MKTLQTSCQVCRRSMKLEFDPELFSDEWIANAATCEDCLSDHTEQERTRIAKYQKAIERESYVENGEWVKPEARKPYND